MAIGSCVIAVDLFGEVLLNLEPNQVTDEISRLFFFFVARCLTFDFKSPVITWPFTVME